MCIDISLPAFRTDSGVHSLGSSAIVTLEAEQDLKWSRFVAEGRDGRLHFDPRKISGLVNELFAEGEIPIRSVQVE